VLFVAAMMTRPIVLALLAGCSSPTRFTDGGPEMAPEPGKTYRVSFDEGSGFPDAMSNVLGDWSRAAEASAPSPPNVLRQTGEYHNADFPRVLLNHLTFTNSTVRVRCRPESGETDRACGLLFRARDSDNYLLTRANALEGNVRFYRVVGGSRMQLASANRKVTSGAWHTLEAEARGEDVVIRWDGEEVLRSRDATFARGKVGLWTKADSVTAFDDLEVVENHQ
jgi:hypothetical protein